MKAVITGACGFIGRNLTAHLLAAGYEILAIDCADRCFTDDPHITYVRSDLTEISGCIDERFMGSEVIYHLAWAGVRPEDRNDLSVQQKNIGISVNVVELAKALDIKRAVFVGSTMEYCYNEGEICEASLPTPHNSYGSVKTAVRFICQQLCRDYGIAFEYAVLTSIYGKGREDNNVIFYCIRSLLNGEVPKLTKCIQRWDFIHIDDAAEALKLIGEKGKPFAFYAVGTAENRRLSEYIDIICEITGGKAEFGAVEYKDGLIANSAICIDRLNADTGFKPTISFGEGIRAVVDHYRRK